MWLMMQRFTSTGCMVSAAVIRHPARLGADVAAFKQLISVTTPDKYTVVFKWKTAKQRVNYRCSTRKSGTSLCIENPDVVKKWGNTLDWHHAIGTGPFILKDFVADNHAYLEKNPDYWGHDERYPQNKIPYIPLKKSGKNECRLSVKMVK